MGQVTEVVGKLRESHKKRNFTETCDLQVMLRDINPEKDKRFNGSVVLQNEAKTKLKVAVIANANHKGVCDKTGVTNITLDDVKKFNKDKKTVKKWCKQYDYLLVSASINKQVMAQIGKILSQFHRLPLPITDDEAPASKIK